MHEVQLQFKKQIRSQLFQEYLGYVRYNAKRWEYNNGKRQMGSFDLMANYLVK